MYALHDWWWHGSPLSTHFAVMKKLIWQFVVTKWQNNQHLTLHNMQRQLVGQEWWWKTFPLRSGFKVTLSRNHAQSNSLFSLTDYYWWCILTILQTNLHKLAEESRIDQRLDWTAIVELFSKGQVLVLRCSNFIRNMSSCGCCTIFWWICHCRHVSCSANSV